MKKKVTRVAGCTFSTATDMECLEDACYWVSTKILESVREGKKRSKKALEHNRKRVIDQMAKMNLISNEE